MQQRQGDYVHGKNWRENPESKCSDQCYIQFLVIEDSQLSLVWVFDGKHGDEMDSSMTVNSTIAVSSYQKI